MAQYYSTNVFSKIVIILKYNLGVMIQGKLDHCIVISSLLLSTAQRRTWQVPTRFIKTLHLTLA